MIFGGLADSCEFGLTKARPQDAARRLNLKESKGVAYPNLNAMPTQRGQFVFFQLEKILKILPRQKVHILQAAAAAASKLFYRR